MEVLTIEELTRLYEGPQIPPKTFEIIVYTYNGIKAVIKEQQKTAYSLVQKAFATGELTRPSICQDCGSIDFRLHGHHEDYRKPLELEWLCSSCHINRRDCVDMAIFRLLEVLGDILQHEAKSRDS